MRFISAKHSLIYFRKLHLPYKSVQSRQMNFKLYFIASLALFMVACSNTENQAPIEVNFQEPNRADENVEQPGAKGHLRVIVSAMVSPEESYKYYEELFNFISERIGREVQFLQRKTYKEANDLLLGKQADVGFICSGAYIHFREVDSVEILAVPVVNGKPFYQAYVIVHKSLPEEKFEQLRGKSFAFTDPMSNTGKLYAERKLRELGTRSNAFFSKTIYSHGHDISLQMVNKKLVDAAVIDGLVYDYFEKMNPHLVSEVKIIEKSELFGIPPVVCHGGVSKELKARIRHVMFTMHQDSLGNAILDKLQIDKFIPGLDENYNSIRKSFDQVY